MAARFLRPFSALLLVLAAIGCSSTIAVPRETAPRTDTLALARREAIAMAIHQMVQRDFAHWEAVPNLDLDTLARGYLRAVRASSERRAFDLTTHRFLAALHNSHTTFVDDWLDERAPGPMGFRARPLSRGWLVTSSRLPTLGVGDTILSVDGRDIEVVFAQAWPYIEASSERIARERLFSTSYLFPSRFSLRVSGGKDVDVDRPRIPRAAAPPHEAVVARRLDSTGTLYLRIPSFDGKPFESDALRAVREHRDAHAMLIDVRGNGGGNTPAALLKALLVEPASWWREASTMRTNPFTVFPKHRAAPSHGHPGQPRILDGVRTISPDGIFRGRLVILVDRWCASSCEDFVMPLKLSGRATLVGERSFGSTGQPRIASFGDGMRVSVGAKRAYFPDGSPFEGVGVAPDVEVKPDAVALRQGRDLILEAAIALVRQR